MSPAPLNSKLGRWIAALLATALAVAGFLHLRDEDPAPPREIVESPYEFSAPEWDSLLEGDTGVTAEDYAALNDYHPGVRPTLTQAAAQIAAVVTAAELGGNGRDAFPAYWPPAPTTTTPAPRRCTELQILAASPAKLPVPQAAAESGSTWLKTLVAYTGTCGETRYTDTAPGIEYVYLRVTPQDTAPEETVAPADGAGGEVDGKTAAPTPVAGERVEPVRPWDVPATEQPETHIDLADWELTTITECPIGDGTTKRLRTFAAQALDQMCRAAKAEGVVLVVDTAYRTRAEQAKLFAQAVDYYGSKAQARNWVAYADDQVCESKACEGTALNIEPDNAALSWLNATVGCSTAGTVIRATSCGPGQTQVRRAQTYGFVLPYERIPGYLEFVLRTDDGETAPADCDPADGVGVDVMVASVFRCRLQQLNVSPPEVEQVVAQALVVSKCASGWNAGARVYAGRYANEPNPADGRYYTETGVFGLRADLARTGWVTGAVTDPVANINAAASMWLATRGWEQFGCATGTDSGIPAGPVLPSYGGPDIPAWATRY